MGLSWSTVEGDWVNYISGSELACIGLGLTSVVEFQKTYQEVVLVGSGDHLMVFLWMKSWVQTGVIKQCHPWN